MNDIIIRESISKVVKTIIWGIVFIFLGSWYSFVGVFDNIIIYLIIGMLILLVCITGLCFIIKNVIYKRALLTINDNGINDRSTVSSVGFVDWRNIKSVYKLEKFKQKFLAIDVVDLNKVVNNISPLKKFIIKLNLKLKYPVICINLDTADMELDEVLKIISRRLDHNIN